MSLLTQIDADIPLTSLEVYDGGVFRTIDSPFSLPYQSDELRVPYEFYFAENVNPLFDKLYTNIKYLEGFSKIYNSVLPVAEIDCDEYLDNNLGFRTSDTLEATFNKTQISLFQKGVLQQTLIQTQFGRFFDIRDVAFQGDDLYVLDGNFLLKLDVNSNPFEFLTYFGGLGSASSEYKFKDPTQILVDGDQIYVFDQGSQVLKQYNDFLSFEGNVELADAVAVDILKGEVFQLTPTQLIFRDQVINHGIPQADKIKIDTTQEGFVWIASHTRLKKYAFNGLEIYSNERSDLNSLVRYETSLMTVEGGKVKREIEYQFTTTILAEGDLVYPLTSVVIQPDELNSDAVVNDSIFKIYEILNDFSKRIVGRFVSTLDAESNYISVDVEPLAPYVFSTEQDNFVEDTSLSLTLDDIQGQLESDGVLVNDDYLIYEMVESGDNRSFVVVDVDTTTEPDNGPPNLPLNLQIFHRHDEFVSCHAWDRTLDGLYDIFETIRNRLAGIEVFDINSGNVDSLPESDTNFVDSISWRLGAQTCDDIGPQLFNPNFTPISFEELSIPALNCHPLTGDDCSLEE